MPWGSYSRARRLYLSIRYRPSREALLARQTGHHALVIASNRLPVRFTLSGDEFEVQPSAGGLAAALRAGRGDAVWIGWPGTVVPEHLQPEATKSLEKDNLVPVFISADEEEDFYGRVCNDTLGRCLHYFGDRRG